MQKNILYTPATKGEVKKEECRAVIHVTIFLSTRLVKNDGSGLISTHTHAVSDYCITSTEERLCFYK